MPKTPTKIVRQSSDKPRQSSANPRQRRLRQGDVVRVSASAQAKLHIAEMHIPSTLHGCFAMVQSIGDHGVCFSSSRIPGREFHLPTERIGDTLILVESNKALMPAHLHS